MDLEWESYLKSSKDTTQPRELFSVSDTDWRLVTPRTAAACDDEFVSAFLEFREAGADLVVAVWDEPFQGDVLEGVVLG
jgi:hypothetical protein